MKYFKLIRSGIDVRPLLEEVLSQEQAWLIDTARQDKIRVQRETNTIFLSAAESNDNPQSLEIRTNIANLAAFVMKQTIEMQLSPDPAKLKSLIDINCNIAAGLAGRG